jgi:peptidoglycan/xylan/chitin deacetylase (PgdA/CDA1 family)
MYHRFREDDHDAEGMRASAFRDQLRSILEHHPVWTPEQQIRARLDGVMSDDCPVVITADDGYKDYHEVAYPILQEFGVPAVLFITTGFVDGSDWMWWDKIRYICRHAGPGASELPLDGQDVPLDFSTPAAREATIKYLINRGRFVSDRKKRAMLDRLSRKLAVDLPIVPPDEVGAVTWDQVREMHRNGQIFAPHSMTHPILTRIDSDQVAVEIRGSRDRLIDILGSAGRIFAYPQGGPSDFDEDVSRQVAAAGFVASYLAYQGPCLDDDPLQWPRYSTGECMASFRWALCGAEHIANRLRRFLGLAIAPGEQYWYGSVPLLSKKPDSCR